jgi:hypothetical protein
MRTTALVRVARQWPQARHGGVAAFSSGTDKDAVAANSALRQQLEFCCLVGGWDTPCMTCPFDWHGFDPKERYRILRRTPRGANDAEAAMKILGMAPSTALDERAVKAAFRRQALEWHPDCNKDPSAEERFREILDAYELLLAILSSP